MSRILYTPKHVDLFGGSSVDLAAALASYSADRIGEAGAIRKPFRMDGADWVCVSSGGTRDTRYSIRFYRLSTASEFGEGATTYSAKTRDSEAARNDPNGFYHGITVKSGGKTLILTGPEYELLAEPTAFERETAKHDDDELEDDDQLEDDDEDEDEPVPVCKCGVAVDLRDNYYEVPCGFLCDECSFDHCRECETCNALCGFQFTEAAHGSCPDEDEMQGEIDGLTPDDRRIWDQLPSPCEPVQLDMFGGAA